MFAESLLESSGASRRTHRGWTTAASLVLQIFVISALAIVPMLYPQALSLARRSPQIPIFSSAPQPVRDLSTERISATPSAVTFIPASSAIHYGPARTQTEIGEIAPPRWIGAEEGPRLNMIGTTPAPVIHAQPPTKPLVISHP